MPNFFVNKGGVKNLNAASGVASKKSEAIPSSPTALNLAPKTYGLATFEVK